MVAIRRASAELILDARAIHGEGPAWDALTGRLLWVDMMGERLHLTTPDSHDEVVAYRQPGAASRSRGQGADSPWRWAMGCGSRTETGPCARSLRSRSRTHRPGPCG